MDEFILQYNGKRTKHKTIKGISIFGLVSGLLILMFMIANVDKDYYAENWFQLILIGFLIIPGLLGVLKPEGNLIYEDVVLRESGLHSKKIGTISYETIHLNIYKNRENLIKFYHLWDDHGRFTIFSKENDDLVDALNRKNIGKTEVMSDSPFFSKDNVYVIKCENGTELLFSQDEGRYIISQSGKEKNEMTASFYMLNPKFTRV